MRPGRTPIRTCRFCGSRGRWTVYVIADLDNPKVGTGKRKWWECPSCDTERTENKDWVQGN